MSAPFPAESDAFYPYEWGTEFWNQYDALASAFENIANLPGYLEGDDICQEVFMRLAEYPERIIREGEVASLAYRVGFNIVQDAIRKERGEAHDSDGNVFPRIWITVPDELRVEQSDGQLISFEKEIVEKNELAYRLNVLNAEEKGLFIQYFLEGQTLRRLSELYELPVTTIHYRLQKMQERCRNVEI